MEVNSPLSILVERMKIPLLESTKGYSFAALYGEKGHPFLLEHMDAYMPCLLGVIAHMLKVEYFSFQAARNVK